MWPRIDRTCDLDLSAANALNGTRPRVRVDLAALGRLSFAPRGDRTNPTRGTVGYGEHDPKANRQRSTPTRQGREICLGGLDALRRGVRRSTIAPTMAARTAEKKKPGRPVSAAVRRAVDDDAATNDRQRVSSRPRAEAGLTRREFPGRMGNNRSTTARFEGGFAQPARVKLEQLAVRAGSCRERALQSSSLSAIAPQSCIARADTQEDRCAGR